MTGGYAAIAAGLEKHYGKPFSRQLVWRWWTRRSANGFPAGRRDAGKIVFDLDQVIAWYGTYVPGRGGRPRKAVSTR